MNYTELNNMKNNEDLIEIYKSLIVEIDEKVDALLTTRRQILTRIGNLNYKGE